MPNKLELLKRIPDLDIPNAAFRPYVKHQGLVYISGQLPVANGKPGWVGRVPDEISIDQAKEAAVLCTLNVLSWVKRACEGDLDRVERCIRLGGFINVADGFCDAPAIINSASEIVTTIFGDQGAHARIAIGVASLPFGAPVEVEAVFAVR